MLALHGPPDIYVRPSTARVILVYGEVVALLLCSTHGQIAVVLTHLLPTLLVSALWRGAAGSVAQLAEAVTRQC